jgi:hypothetical protein
MDLKLFRQHLLKIQEAQNSNSFTIVNNHDGGKLVFRGDPKRNAPLVAVVAASGETYGFQKGTPYKIGVFKTDKDLLDALGANTRYHNHR